VKVHFVLPPGGGQPQQVQVRDSYKSSFFDRSAIRAIYYANPLPPLPPELGTEPFGVSLTFYQQY
jgi:TonB family protein